jgi:hypothetical protein
MTFFVLSWQLKSIIIIIEGSVPEGAPVPLPSVLFEIAIMRQKAGFFSDPVRENFASYGRIQFAYDLFRLKNRIIDGFELKLLVANMLQTKHDDAHIWIPSSSGDDGTHFASVYFSRA